MQRKGTSEGRGGVDLGRVGSHLQSTSQRAGVTRHARRGCGGKFRTDALVNHKRPPHACRGRRRGLWFAEDGQVLVRQNQKVVQDRQGRSARRPSATPLPVDDLCRRPCPPPRVPHAPCRRVRAPGWWHGVTDKRWRARSSGCARALFRCNCHGRVRTNSSSTKPSCTYTRRTANETGRMKQCSRLSPMPIKQRLPERRRRLVAGG